MIKNLKSLVTLCKKYHCNLNIKFYGEHEVAFAGYSDYSDAEVFNVCIPNRCGQGYHKKLRERAATKIY